MKSRVMVALAAINPTDPLGIVFVIASVRSMVGVQADNTALRLDHHPCLPPHVLLHVVGAVGQAVLQSLT